MRLPFFGPTLYWGKSPFWKVPDEHWAIYLAERERSEMRFLAVLFSSAIAIAAIGWMFR